MKKRSVPGYWHAVITWIKHIIRWFEKTIGFLVEHLIGNILITILPNFQLLDFKVFVLHLDAHKTRIRNKNVNFTHLKKCIKMFFFFHVLSVVHFTLTIYFRAVRTVEVFLAKRTIIILHNLYVDKKNKS